MPLRLIAHQGGWDEILLLALPAVAVILWVRWAERRARTRREQEPPAPPTNIAADADD
ncbi:MAG: hypothetical protein WEE36_03490 [Acidimicrobiia bacterium]